ncbi:SPW repeat protein [Streptomyces sp. NBC_01716]|uniref:SPW repeat protein n=1 Tax=Streptomyces sp. NBC_01716 TaxID=2975917 RepID=UPI002E38117F|nr:SPW repeat protein [Streptomyces sp. NBC_01716]
MADVSHTRGASSAHPGASDTRGDIGAHPDVPEMRARYARVLGGRDVALLDGPIFLAGLFIALSPFILHFTTSQPGLVIHNVIMGIAIAGLALVFSATPTRTYGFSWALVFLGAWMVAAPWVVGSSPDRGVFLSNVIPGALTAVLGLICAGAALMAARKRTRVERTSRMNKPVQT